MKMQQYYSKNLSVKEGTTFMLNRATFQQDSEESGNQQGLSLIFVESRRLTEKWHAQR